MKRTNFYRVFMSESNLITDCLIHEDRLNDFLYQHRESKTVLVKDRQNSLHLRTQDVKIVEYSNEEVKRNTEMDLENIRHNDLNGKWTPLSFYLISFDVFSTEQEHFYAEDERQANRDFEEWCCIFDPKEITLVA